MSKRTLTGLGIVTLLGWLGLLGWFRSIDADTFATTGFLPVILADTSRSAAADCHPQPYGHCHALRPADRDPPDGDRFGAIGPDQVLQIWAMAEDAGQGGYNCGFGSDIWNNSEPDAAHLIDPSGVVISRW